MIQTKLIIDSYLACETCLDEKINKFIEQNNIKVIDIKFTSTLQDRATALIIYEVEDEQKENN